MTDWLRKDTRVVVIDGPHAGKTGRALRPDGELHGKPVWQVKLDHAFFGAAIEVAHLRPAKVHG